MRNTEIVARPMSGARRVVVILLVVAPLLLCASGVYYWVFAPGTPPEIPIYPNAQHVERKGGQEAASTMNALAYISFDTTDRPENVNRFYDDVLTKGEWRPHGNRWCDGCRFTYISQRRTNSCSGYYWIRVIVEPPAQGITRVGLTLGEGIVTCDCMGN